MPEDTPDREDTRGLTRLPDVIADPPALQKAIG